MQGLAGQAGVGKTIKNPPTAGVGAIYKGNPGNKWRGFWRFF